MIVAYFVGGPIMYFFAAYFFTKASFGQFDLLANRPSEPRRQFRAVDVFVDPKANKPAPPGEGAGPVDLT